MKTALLALLIIDILSSCGENSSTPSGFQTFDFSYNDTWSTSFSIKFTQKDSVFIRQHFVYAGYIGDTVVKDHTSYFATLNHAQILKLDSFIRNIDFEKYDTSYLQDLQDGISSKFYIQNDSLSKSIYIYGDNSPVELRSFAMWIADLKSNLQLIAIDTLLDFVSFKNFEPPTIPGLDTMKFIPPDMKND